MLLVQDGLHVSSRVVCTSQLPLVVKPRSVIERSAVGAMPALSKHAKPGAMKRPAAKAVAKSAPKAVAKSKAKAKAKSKATAAVIKPPKGCKKLGSLAETENLQRKCSKHDKDRGLYSSCRSTVGFPR